VARQHNLLVGERPGTLLQGRLEAGFANGALCIDQGWKDNVAVPLRVDAAVYLTVKGMQNRGNKVASTVVTVGANLDDSILNQVFLQPICGRRPNRTPQPAPWRSKTVNNDFRPRLAD
jgi:hypothetical protein